MNKVNANKEEDIYFFERRYNIKKKRTPVRSYRNYKGSLTQSNQLQDLAPLDFNQEKETN